MNAPDLRLLILIENSSCSDQIIPEHGFSVYVEYGDWKGLFDTGQSDLLLHNAQYCGVDLEKLDFISLSHGHYDHTGGLLHVLKNSPGNITVYASPDCFSPKYAVNKDGEIYENGMPSSWQNVKLFAREIVFVGESAQVCPGIHMIGPAPMESDCEEIQQRFKTKSPENGKYIQDFFRDERSLVIETAKGLVVITGCAHRGAINITQHVKSMFPDKPIRLLLGGFHLGEASSETIENKIHYFRKAGLEGIGLAHCTGGKASRVMREEFGDMCFLAPAGTEIEFTDRK